ncbi:MAG TPA: DMT family transporter [Bdellovibrionales bacterium]|nr:DMT family transporter [Bdellovibrionales bacterium]
MSQRAIGLWMATVTALSWAVLAIALKFALHKFSSGTIVWTRMALAFAILLVLFTFVRRHWLGILKTPPWAGVLCGVLIACNYYGFMKGIELTSASNAQIMIQLAPMSFALISIFMFGEIPTLVQGTGLVTALTGFGFFYWDQILVAVDDLERFQTGNLWILFAAATWCGFALIQKRLIKTVAPQQFNLLIYGISGVLLAPLTTWPELAHVNAWDIALILFLALNTVVAYGALSEALNRIPASHVSVIIAVNPLLTIAIMWYLTTMQVQWIAGEPIHWRGGLGALLVVVGVILTVRPPRPLSTLRTSPTL